MDTKSARVEFDFGATSDSLWGAGNKISRIGGGERMTKEELSDRLLEFAARTGKVIEATPETRMGRHITTLCSNGTENPVKDLDFQIIRSAQWS